MRKAADFLLALIPLLCCLPTGVLAQQTAVSVDGKALYQSEQRAGAALMRRAAVAPRYDYDVRYYGIHLRVHADSGYVEGYLRFRATAGVGLGPVLLDMSADLRADSVLDAAGRPLSFTQPTAEHPLLAVVLPEVPAAGTEIDLRVYYHGYPGRVGDGAFTRGLIAGGLFAWTLSEPFGAPDWFPCKNTPADKADSADIVVTVKVPLKVASNGRLVSVTDAGGGWSTWHWKERYPIAMYLLSLAIADYDTFTDWYRYTAADSMPVVNYIYRNSNAGYIRSQSQAVLAALDIYSTAYGPYPFLKEKYGQAEFTWGGGMEHQTMTSLGSFATRVIVHELAHQWFGDALTCASWQDIWLNEGFATFSEGLYTEKTAGEPAYRSWLAGLEKVVTSRPGGFLYIPALQISGNTAAASERIFDQRLSYDKGGLVLHMLRYTLGDSLFFAALQQYAEGPHRYGSVTTDDFRRSVEQTTGRDLGSFFRQWVYGQGYPVYTVRYGIGDTKPPFRVLVQIHQENSVGDTLVFRMPLEIRFASDGADSTVTVRNDRQDQSYTFELPFFPVQVQLDPGSNVLKRVQTYQGFAPGTEQHYRLPAHPVLNQNFPNPFNPATKVSYYMDRGGAVTISVYDLTGRRVATLLDAYRPQGYYSVTWNASGLASGLYLIRLQALGHTQIRKAILLR